jgi:formate-dependent phosphoribosylglycinamide formyltransferase (GAR transformylase)
MTSSLLSYCESITFILPGAEVRQTLLRTALRSLAIKTGGKTSSVRVAESFAPVMRAARDAGLPVAALERAMREAGLRDGGKVG